MTEILKGTTNYSTTVRVIDSGDGTPETGLGATDAGTAFTFHRDGAAGVAITGPSDLSSSTDAHTDGGLLHLGNGYYRVDFQDAAYASGSDKVLLEGAATGMIVIGREITLVGYDPNDSVKLGLTTFPTNFVDLSISATSGLVNITQVAADKVWGTTARILTASTNFNDFDPANDAVATVTTLTNKTGFSLAATGLDAIASTATGMVEIAKAVWDRIISKANHDVGQSAGKILRLSGNIAQVDGQVSDASPAVGGFDTNITDIDTYWEDALLVFSNGAANAGLGLPISTFLNANGAMTFAAPDDWPITPVNGDDFTIYGLHVHPVAQIADAVMAAGDIDGFTLEETQKLQLAALAGKASGLATTTAIYRAADDTKPRITATVDANGNRSAVTLDETG